jgi:hypothetical protein
MLVQGTTEDTMQLQAEVKCYHCGRVSGTWQWRASAGPAFGTFEGAEGAGRVSAGLAQIHCAQCGGPIFLDEVAEVRAPSVLVFERPRPGRPRKGASVA